MKRLLLILLMLGIGLAILSRSPDKVAEPSTPNRVSTPPSSPPAPDPRQEERTRQANAVRSLSLKIGAVSKEHGVMTATFTIQNSSDYDIKDIAVKCEHTAASGTRIDSNARTIFEVFSARSTKTIRGFNMGFIHTQARSTSCGVEDATVLTYRPPPPPKPAPRPSNAPLPLSPPR